MYIKKFATEAMEHFGKTLVGIDNSTPVVYSQKQKEEMVSRYEQLVPEFKDFHLQISEESKSKMASLILRMMKEFDSSPAANTVHIKKAISEEKMTEYIRVFEERPDYFKSFLKKVFPWIFDEEVEAESRAKADLDYRFSAILEAQARSMAGGTSTVRKELKDYINNPPVENTSVSDERFKKLMEKVNSMFAWMCKHEGKVMKEYGKMKEKNTILFRTIKDLYFTASKSEDNSSVDTDSDSDKVE